MKTFKYVIQDKVGIHARPANKLVQALSHYDSSIFIRYSGKESNAKSIINLMSMGLQYNSEVEFVIEGSDEEKVLAELPEFLRKEGI